MTRVILIGLGVMGRNHYRVLKTLPNVEIVALCDPVMDEFDGNKVFKNVDDAFKKVAADAAVIAVPTFLHKEIALKCIEKNLHILIEKPAASTAQEAREIIDALNGEICSAVGHIERFNPVVTALKNELTDKDIYSIAITRVGPFPPRIADVGILTDLAVHDVDLIRFITGKEILDRHIFSSQKIHNHHEDNAIISLKLESEVVATITTNWLTPYKKRKIEVATPAGYYEADLISQDLRVYSAYTTSQSYLVRDVMVQKGEPLRNELNAFVALCTTGDRSGLATIEDSIKSLELVRIGSI